MNNINGIKELGDQIYWGPYNNLRNNVSELYASHYLGINEIAEYWHLSASINNSIVKEIESENNKNNKK